MLRSTVVFYEKIKRHRKGGREKRREGGTLLSILPSYLHYFYFKFTMTSLMVCLLCVASQAPK